MLRHKRAVVAFVAIVASIGLIAMGSSSSAQNNLTGKEVVVVNTPEVNAWQSGQWSVGITPTGNSVNVANPVQVTTGGGNPLLVRSVDPVAARRPFRKHIDLNISPADYSRRELFEVPEGEQLVIEFVTLYAQVSEDSWLHMAIESFTLGNPDHTRNLVPAHDRLDASSGRRVVHLSEMTRITTEPGATVIIRVWREGSPSQTSAQITLDGYFERVPPANQN